MSVAKNCRSVPVSTREMFSGSGVKEAAHGIEFSEIERENFQS